MNPLLGIAKITHNRRIIKYCAIQRYKQLNRRWAKQKAAASTATDPLELTWD